MNQYATIENGAVIYGKLATKISVDNSTIRQNNAGWCGAMYVASASVLQISFSKVVWNSAGIYSAVSCVLDNSFFIAINSLFEENMGHLDGSLKVENSTGYLESCNFIDNQGTSAGAISFKNTELRLSNTVFVQNMTQLPADIRSKISMDTFYNKLFTWRCSFIHNNKIFNSNSSNFKQIAINEHIIAGIDYYTQSLSTSETQFESSKFLFLKTDLFWI